MNRILRHKRLKTGKLKTRKNLIALDWYRLWGRTPILPQSANPREGPRTVATTSAVHRTPPEGEVQDDGPERAEKR
jgi:hypothetical protein